jgi:hypothetical protein
MAYLAHTEPTLVVRLWRDRADGTWRGQLTDVQTGVRRHFTTVGELGALLEEKAPGFSAPHAEPEPGSQLAP